MNEKDKIVYQRLIYYNDEEHLAKRIIELQHCCENLQSKIDKAIELNENIRKKLLICSSYEKDEVEDLLFEQLDILKEDK